MDLFVVTTIRFEEAGDPTVFQAGLEEIGLRSVVIMPDEAFEPLPDDTWIGEYQFSDKNELKNILYTEIKGIAAKAGASGRIFISVSERAVIGVTDF